MRDVVLRFIGTLRTSGLRVSLSESMDAVQAVAALGVERECLREALAASLVKEEEDRPLFDEAFTRFFAAPETRRKGKRQPQAGEGEGQQAPAGSTSQGEKSESPPSEEENQKAKSKSKLEDRRSRIEDRGRQEARKDPSAIGNPQSEQSPILDSRFSAPTQAKLARHKALLEKPFKAFDPRDVEAAKELVEDLARRLRGRLSRRYKPRKRGRLDFRRTLRAALGHGGVPVELLLRGRRPGKPDLVALCDLSGSVAIVSDFLLALLTPASAYFRRVRTFAYVDRLCEVSFEHGHVVPHAMLDLYAYSDFGKVLQHFWQEHGEQLLTRNTLVLILGDARNNRRPPRVDLLARIREHAQKLVWLNPEPRERWNTGDSVISRYAPVCDAVVLCTHLKELLHTLKREL